MKINYIALRDKPLFNKHLCLCGPHYLSAYAFENIFIWKDLYDIFWVNIRGSLCIFFKDAMGCFMYLPPLGKKVEEPVFSEAFAIMDEYNRNKEISRIENIEENNASLFRALGYALAHKSDDYLCLQKSVAELKGEAFKSKRASYNYFVKHYDADYLHFILKYKDACLVLYDLWKSERLKKNKDTLYGGMINDSRRCLEVLLAEYQHLDMIGRVVRIEKEIKAFTFGYALNKEVFCILYEVVDLSFKGLAQYIFREFCLEKQQFRYINLMDDSGFENLKKVKLSYRPEKNIPAYIATRKKRAQQCIGLLRK